MFRLPIVVSQVSSALRGTSTHRRARGPQPRSRPHVVSGGLRTSPTAGAATRSWRSSRSLLPRVHDAVPKQHRREHVPGPHQIGPHVFTCPDQVTGRFTMVSRQSLPKDLSGPLIGRAAENTAGVNIQPDVRTLIHDGNLQTFTCGSTVHTRHSGMGTGPAIHEDPLNARFQSCEKDRPYSMPSTRTPETAQATLGGIGQNHRPMRVAPDASRTGTA